MSGTLHLVELSSNHMRWLRMVAGFPLTYDLPACDAKLGAEITLIFGVARIVFEEEEKLQLVLKVFGGCFDKAWFGCFLRGSLLEHVCLPRL